jgi:hypothetical protein
VLGGVGSGVFSRPSSIDGFVSQTDFEHSHYCRNQKVKKSPDCSFDVKHSIFHNASSCVDSRQRHHLICHRQSENLTSNDVTVGESTYRLPSFDMDASKFSQKYELNEQFRQFQHQTQPIANVNSTGIQIGESHYSLPPRTN